MVTLPQKTALPLIAELNDEAKVEAAWTRVQEMIAKGEATLVANLIAKGFEGARMLPSQSRR